MSEGDLLKGSPEDTATSTDNQRTHRRTSSPSPPRSRSQSAGSAHKEALLFFERHQLLQNNDLPPLLGITIDACDTYGEGHWVQQDNSTEISSLSKSPSPAHFSDVLDVQCSSVEERRFLTKSTKGNKTCYTGREDNSILKVRSANNLTVNSCEPKHYSKNSQSKAGAISGSLEQEKLSPSRNRSIRGRSHSQPSQVILCSTGEHCTNRRKRDSRNWLEQIQFTAQYKHYRTNDYASVVNSASSLDQVGIDQGQRINITQAGGTPPQTRVSIDSQNIKQSNLREHNQDTSQSGLSNKISCWNFPRVKLRRIFNAKSLDDIFGRSRKTLGSPGPEPCDCFDAEELSSGGITEGITGGATTTSGYFSDVTPTKSKNSSLTSLKIFNPTNTVDISSSIEAVGEGGNSHGSPLQQLSYLVESSSSGVSCEKPLQITTSPNKNSRKSSSHLTSTLASVLRVPQFQFNPSGNKKRWSNLKKGNKEKPSKSLSSGSLNRVTCANAKSNNYLNRIVASATCARFNVGNSIDNLITTNTVTNTSSYVPESDNNSSSCTSCTTIVEPFINKSITNSSGVPAGQQRRWTAVKQKWDLKLHSNPQGSESSSPTNNSSPQNLLFVKSNLSRISGVDVTTQPGVIKEYCQLESLTSYQNSIPTSKSEEYESIQPHEPGRVSFRLEPEEIPSIESPTISRSQSSDCRPQEIDPNLILNTPSEEESEEMTKSRHFHYRDINGRGTNTSGSRNQRKEHLLNQNQTPEAGPNKGKNSGTMTSKEKAQLVVANVTYLQRPTSPCVLIPGDPSYTHASPSSTSHFQQTSSPIVFTDNNYPTNQQIHSQSIISPGNQTNASMITKPERPSAYNARMRHEYLTSSSQVGFDGAKNINLFSSKEPQQIVHENINKSSPRGPGGSSTFVPCYNRNDVVSPTRGTGLTSGANAKPSLYGGVGGRVQDPCHDDITIYSYKDNVDNKNVTYLGDSSSSRRNKGDDYSASGGFQPIDRDQSSKLHSGFTSIPSTDPNAFRAYHGYDKHTSQDNQNQPNTSLNSGNQEEEEESLQKFNNSKSVETEADEMGDLQSPTYVKRTANMFNSRYSSPQHNGSASTVSSDHIKENRNPSYLNVSRSVSGYSCLSYSNGNGVANGSSSTNGASNAKNMSSPYSQKFTSPSTKIRSEFTVKVNQPQVRDTFDQNYVIHDDHRSIKSPTNYKSKSSYEQEPLQVEETIEESSYVPSHGKSFIMQRIERLYGSDAVSSAGVFSRKSSDSKGLSTTTTIRFETSLQSSNSSGKERVIPIQIEQGDYPVAKEHHQDQRNLPFERHVRGDEILTSDSDSNEPISPNSSTSLKMKSTKHTTTIGGVYEGIALESCPGKHRLHTVSLDEEERRQLFTQKNVDRSSKESNPSSIFGKHVNGKYTNGSHNTSKNDSGIVLDDKEIDNNMGPTEEFDDFHTTTNANDPIAVGAPGDNISSLKSPSSGDKPSRHPVALVKTILTANDSGILDAEDYSSIERPLAAVYSHRKSSLSSNSSSSSGSPEPGGSPSKPKLKPKPKDMALLRTLSHSPQPKALLAERSGFSNISTSASESQDKTGMYSNITLDKIIGGQRPNQMGEDRVDLDDSNKKLSDIRNILKISSPKGESPEESEEMCKPPVVLAEVTVSSSKVVEDRQKNKENDFKPVSDPQERVKDGNYFLIEMNKAKKELQKHADKATIDLEKLDPQSEAAGNTLSAIGKANLLTKKKFKQFEELCNANMKGVTGDQPATTNEDLDGFWDMVMIQVDQVFDLFKELDGIKSTDSTDGAKTKVLLSPRKTVSSSTKVSKPVPSKSQSSAAAKARDESRRKLLAEKRRLMKDQAQASSANVAQEDVLIFTPDQTDD